jgi:hypothetical protein
VRAGGRVRRLGVRAKEGESFCVLDGESFCLEALRFLREDGKSSFGVGKSLSNDGVKSMMDGNLGSMTFLKWSTYC